MNREGSKVLTCKLQVHRIAEHEAGVVAHRALVHALAAAILLPRHLEGAVT